MTIAHTLHLKKTLKENIDPTGPRVYHDRTGHYLPDCDSMMTEQVEKLNKFVEDNDMKINQDKSKVMLFNTSWKYDFLPKVTIDGENNLEVVEEMKLLGVIIQSNMKWNSNTQNLCKRGYQRLWMLRNLVKHGAGITDLLDVYIKQCRCLLELAVPVWNPAISHGEVYQLERVQKTAFSIILGNKYQSYEEALDLLNMKTLEERRLEICISFAKKAQNHAKFQTWFSDSTEPSPTPFQPVPCRTGRFKKSPLPYLTDLLNET